MVVLEFFVLVDCEVFFWLVVDGQFSVLLFETWKSVLGCLGFRELWRRFWSLVLVGVKLGVDRAELIRWGVWSLGCFLGVFLGVFLGLWWSLFWGLLSGWSVWAACEAVFGFCCWFLVSFVFFVYVVSVIT